MFVYNKNSNDLKIAAISMFLVGLVVGGLVFSGQAQTNFPNNTTDTDAIEITGMKTVTGDEVRVLFDLIVTNSSYDYIYDTYSMMVFRVSELEVDRMSYTVRTSFDGSLIVIYHVAADMSMVGEPLVIKKDYGTVTGEVQVSGDVAIVVFYYGTNIVSISAFFDHG